MVGRRDGGWAAHHLTMSCHTGVGGGGQTDRFFYFESIRPQSRMVVAPGPIYQRTLITQALYEVLVPFLFDLTNLSRNACFNCFRF